MAQLIMSASLAALPQEIIDYAHSDGKTLAVGSGTPIPTGFIATFAMGDLPTGWLFCDGSPLNSVTDTMFAELYDTIGTTWGGTGADNFNIPDFRDLTIAGPGDAAAFYCIKY
ncbi:MAG: phage tail protein [Candidatus Poseidoniales archaeon]